MNILFTWIMIGTAIGLVANLLEVYSFSNRMMQSVALGVAGATSGGLVGEMYRNFGTSIQSMSETDVAYYASPLLFAFIGAAILVLIPGKGDMLD